MVALRLTGSPVQIADGVDAYRDGVVMSASTNALVPRTRISNSRGWIGKGVSRDGSESLGEVCRWHCPAMANVRWSPSRPASRQ